MRISFTEAHGARNDFLLTWSSEAPQARLEAAAFLMERGLALSPVRILTEAGLKELRLIERKGLCFRFEMEMGRPTSHPHFPNRTNVSFVRLVDRHTLDVRFFERGAGQTMSSGTGSTGAVWAAMLRNLVESPVSVLTPGGILEARWDESSYLSGPAQITGRGEFYFE